MTTSSSLRPGSSSPDSPLTEQSHRVNSRRTVKAPRIRRKKSPTGDMTIVEHINELRRRLVVSLLIIGAGAVVGYLWYGNGVGPIPSLGDLLKRPYCSLPPEQRFGSASGDCRLLATAPLEMFILRLKVGALAGAVFTSPFWLAQIWGYITPGLKKNEKRWTLTVGLSAGLLFVLGAVLAYFVLAYAFDFLLSIGDGTQVAALRGSDYFHFIFTLILVFGVSFEVPLLTVLLNFAGVLSYQQLKEKRRYVILFMFVFAAFVTPGQDPVSMVLLSLALTLMMEIATQIARIHDKRKARGNSEWMNISDDEAAFIGEASPVDSAAGAPVSSSIDAPAPIADYDAVEATPAPRSSSAARPIQQPQPTGRNDLNLSGGSAFDDVL
ncbi:twin-arginine translocase subunit TatC [Corynebacterium auriscanis]|uniref:twin-arginine translocase subunit TatC n=1 Tax=Corynebacterium auriscanis TaxID=99807 RepID=UPI003CE916BD